MSIVDTQVLPTGTWQVDKVHSSSGFAVDYMAGTFHGTFSDFDAAVTDGVLNGSAKVASVQVKDENLAAHLQSPDFFDAQAHPELTFTADAVDRDGDRLTIDGEITIKGHTETAEGESGVAGAIGTVGLHGCERSLSVGSHPRRMREPGLLAPRPASWSRKRSRGVWSRYRWQGDRNGRFN